MGTLTKKFKIGGQFSGVGAFDQALKRLNIDYENIYQAEWDKYARQTYLHNYEEPIYYVQDVHDTPTEEITENYGSLDIAMFSPPCQAFSLAGKRKGEEDKRGVLFYNSHEFIKVNKPRFFIFENVKGLLSDSNGKTFQKWIEYLGGKSVNGNPVLFPNTESVPYHIYYKVLNAKNYGIPQNRERVFIVGIRDDQDNSFTWPKEEFLTKRLKDVLESEVDEKYYLSEKMIDGLVTYRDKRLNSFIKNNVNTNDIELIDAYNQVSNEVFSHTITTRVNASNNTFLKIGFINQNTQASQVYCDNGLGQTLCAGTHGYANGYVKINSATKQGYEIAEIGEYSINLEHPNSETRLGRVGEKVAQTLTTSCNQGVAEVNVVANLPGKHEQNSRVYGINGVSPTLTTMQGGGQEPKINSDYRIRKLTPRECFRLMDFPDSFTWPVSDSQAYKQAGNSICVGVLAKIIEKLKLF